MNSYRFGYNEEPTDEMLAQIMKEVASERCDLLFGIENIFKILI